ncbi:putative elongation factor 1-delta isoform X2 [Lycorma delicatula]|uniref:putative elongation factor 1-delta isoform X2 n=1 Tax=Lycorma delicatula TaxID=130591 RepID=UPI003F50E64F
MTSPLVHEKVWFNKYKYDEAERQYFENLAKVSSNNPIMKNTLAGEVAKARQHIQSSLECMDGIAALASNPSVEVNKRLTNLEKQNQSLQEEIKLLKDLVQKLTLEVSNCRKEFANSSAAGKAVAPTSSKPAQQPPPKKQVPDDDDDDGVDLFGSDSEEEDEEAKKIREQRLAEYASRKSKKPVLIAKSSIILDVKPWSDETNMKELESAVRKIETDGLIWGASKLVPLAYGIHKLQISCVVEDDKVSVDWLQETIQEIEDYVQSVDIAAFNKV